MSDDRTGGETPVFRCSHGFRGVPVTVVDPRTGPWVHEEALDCDLCMEAGWTCSYRPYDYAGPPSLPDPGAPSVERLSFPPAPPIDITKLPPYLGGPEGPSEARPASLSPQVVPGPPAPVPCSYGSAGCSGRLVYIEEKTAKGLVYFWMCNLCGWGSLRAPLVGFNGLGDAT